MWVWDLDLASHTEVEQWHSSLKLAYKGILNVSLIEANVKVITRWDMVPLRLSRVYPFSSPLCFRECNSLGIMYHIWWECQRLRVFWNKFFALIQKISEILVPQQPRIALLNEPIENLPRCKQRLIFLCC